MQLMLEEPVCIGYVAAGLSFIRITCQWPAMPNLDDLTERLRLRLPKGTIVEQGGWQPMVDSPSYQEHLPPITRAVQEALKL